MKVRLTVITAHRFSLLRERSVRSAPGNATGERPESQAQHHHTSPPAGGEHQSPARSSHRFAVIIWRAHVALQPEHIISGRRMSHMKAGIK